MKRTYGVLIGLAICIMLGQGAALADSFSSRAAWIAALAGEPYYDVDLGAAPNSLTAGDTLAANAPISLPPTWDATLSFDMALSVQDGMGVWNQYGANPPLVLATGAQSLVGTFSNGNEGIRAGGFEVLVDAASTLTITLTYLNQTTYVLPVTTAQGIVQFYGWLLPRNGARVASFEIASTVGGITVGNFVLPEGHMPIWLSGLGLLILVAWGSQRFVF